MVDRDQCSRDALESLLLGSLLPDTWSDPNTHSARRLPQWNFLCRKKPPLRVPNKRLACPMIYFLTTLAIRVNTELLCSLYANLLRRTHAHGSGNLTVSPHSVPVSASPLANVCLARETRAIARATLIDWVVSGAARVEGCRRISRGNWLVGLPTQLMTPAAVFAASVPVVPKSETSSTAPASEPADANDANDANKKAHDRMATTPTADTRQCLYLLLPAAATLSDDILQACFWSTATPRSKPNQLLLISYAGHAPAQERIGPPPGPGGQRGSWSVRGRPRQHA